MVMHVVVLLLCAFDLHSVVITLSYFTEIHVIICDWTPALICML